MFSRALLPSLVNVLLQKTVALVWPYMGDEKISISKDQTVLRSCLQSTLRSYREILVSCIIDYRQNVVKIKNRFFWTTRLSIWPLSLNQSMIKLMLFLATNPVPAAKTCLSRVCLAGDLATDIEPQPQALQIPQNRYCFFLTISNSFFIFHFFRIWFIRLEMWCMSKKLPRRIARSAERNDVGMLFFGRYYWIFLQIIRLCIIITQLIIPIFVVLLKPLFIEYQLFFFINLDTLKIAYVGNSYKYTSLNN